MPLILKNFLTRSRIILHPGVKKKLIEQLRQRYEEEVAPESWLDLIHSFDDTDHTPEDFLNTTIDITKNVLESYIRENNIKTIDDNQVEDWVYELWDESQSFWSEISDVIKQNLNFIEKLIKNSKEEIYRLYPNCDKIFGEKATHFLIDLALQNNLFYYTKISKPHLVDMRRMLNISGQIVEEIFSSKIFAAEKSIGDICNILESFKSGPSTEKTTFYKMFPYGKTLLSNKFLDNLKTIKRYRNPYSHGGSSDTNITDDFSLGIRALISDNYGVLTVIYQLLSRMENLL